MILSGQTLNVLKNFSRINKSIIFGNDTCIKTMSLNEAIIGVYIPSENETFEFDEPVGIYDLTNFIATIMSIGDNVDIDFSGEKILLKNNNYELAYGKTELELIQNEASKKQCDKIKNFDDFNASLNITSDEFKKILNIGKTMNFDIIEFTQNSINVFNNSNPLANTFTLKKQINGNTNGIKLMFDNLIMIPGNYTVSITDETVVKFTNQDIIDGELFYFVAPIDE